MEKKLRNQEKDAAIKKAASILGRLGGQAGRGDAKRRPSSVCRAAVMKRWEEYRRSKQEKRADA